MSKSRTALVLASQGDPIFGAIARALGGVAKSVVGLGKKVISKGLGLGTASKTKVAIETAKGTAQTVKKSKTARVILEAAIVAGAGAAGVNLAENGEAVQNGFLVGPGGCAVGKLVNVAAHQRVIPVDRFGRPRRRVNVLNTKALSRATRRLGGFQKRARKVEKQLSRIAPQRRRRTSYKTRCA